MTALFSQDSFRPAVRDNDRIAYVISCMMLVDWYFDRRIDIGKDGTIRARGRFSADDLNNDIDITNFARCPRPAAAWLGYLAPHHRSITVVWQRLVNAGVAAPEERGRLRRRPHRALRQVLASAWAREYLSHNVTATGASMPAVALWNGVRALGLDARALEMQEPDVLRQLDATPLSSDLQPLFDALGGRGRRRAPRRGHP
ncbi:hypothetical protein [Amycolatopsis sp. cmx-4-61]|uniref:hypothetical protein n=1 Tax=Amycolatopsis sp. cmx-4-61 TaxID=2790937 RepID=UPI00397D2A77